MEITRQKLVSKSEEVPDSLEGFKSWRFSTGPMIRKDFKQFAGLYKMFIKDNQPEGAELVEYNKGHYFLSGFIEKDGKFVYFSISDVRYWENEWAENILIRTAENQEDFTGDMNSYTTLENIEEDIKELLSK